MVKIKKTARLKNTLLALAKYNKETLMDEAAKLWDDAFNRDDYEAMLKMCYEYLQQQIVCESKDKGIEIICELMDWDHENCPLYVYNLCHSILPKSLTRQARNCVRCERDMLETLFWEKPVEPRRLWRKSCERVCPRHHECSELKSVKEQFEFCEATLRQIGKEIAAAYEKMFKEW